LRNDATVRNRIATFGGLVCLGVTLALLPAGVNVVRAEDGAEALMSVDPLLAQQPAPSVAPPAPVIPATAAAQLQPGQPADTVSPGVVVLNNRGYNYGPPPAEIDPSAMDREDQNR